MKKAYIQYKNLGKNLGNKFNIYSDKGNSLELTRNNLLNGSVIEVDDNVSKIHVIPKTYDLIASGNSDPQISGLKFAKGENIQVYNFNNYNFISALSGFARTNSSLDSVSISDNSNVIIAGSTQSFNNSTGLYIFTGSNLNNSWNLKQTVLHPLSTGTIGAATAINSNGSTLLTTSPGINGSLGYTFIYTGSSLNNWSLSRVLSGVAINTNYGSFAVMNGNGDIIAVSAGYQNNTEDNRKIYIYNKTGVNTWNLRQILHGNLGFGSFGFNFGHLSMDLNGNVIIASDPDNNRAIVFTGSSINGWTFSTGISGSLSSTSVNENGSVILINDRSANNFGVVKVYTGIYRQFPFPSQPIAKWNLKQIISGEDFNGLFGTSSKIKNNFIAASAPNAGSVITYTGNGTLGWSKFKKFTQNSDYNFGNNLDVSTSGAVVASLRVPRVGDAGSYTASTNVYNYTSKTGVPIYYSDDDQYALWWNPNYKFWEVSNVNMIGNLHEEHYIWTSNTLTGEYFYGPDVSGNFFITSLNNKLRIFNNPGITGFSGTYTSGTYTIGGIPRQAFRNDINQNFYILKNTLPSEWRAVEDLYNGPFTWYTNLNGADNLPPTTGWMLGGGDKEPYINSNYAPALETNFGVCDGNTINYPIFVFQAFSQNSSIQKLQFYSGGIIQDDGSSEFFPQDVKVKDFLPNIDFSKNFLNKNFFYSNYRDNRRYYLFSIINENSPNRWIIANDSGRLIDNNFYYWEAKSGYLTNTEDPDGFIMTGAGASYTNGRYIKSGILNNKPLYVKVENYCPIPDGTCDNSLNRVYLRYGLSDFEKNTPYYQYYDNFWYISLVSNTKIVDSLNFSGSFDYDNVVLKTDGFFYYWLNNQWNKGYQRLNSGASPTDSWEGNPDDFYYILDQSGQLKASELHTTQWLPTGPGGIQGPVPKLIPIYWPKTLQDARKVYTPVSNSSSVISGLKNITLDINRNYLNADYLTSNLDMSNMMTGFSKKYIYVHSSDTVKSLNGVYEYASIYNILMKKYNNYFDKFEIYTPLYGKQIRCADSGSNVWSIFDFNPNNASLSKYVGLKNCSSNPAILPSTWLIESGQKKMELGNQILPFINLKYIELYTTGNVS